MKVLGLILVIQYVFGENYTNTQELNEMEYSHEIKVTGDEAELSFIIYNTSYARDVLNITSYYFSITYIDEKSYEERLPIPAEPLTTNETEYHGVLKMRHLEEEGNYLICVFFLDQTNLIGSSRFCHVVSVSDRCDLEPTQANFNDRYVFILLGFVIVVLAATVLFSYIRDYIYRPRTIEDLLKVLPVRHAGNLENLASMADDRRRRRTQKSLDNRLREDSVRTVDSNPDTDHDYSDYYGIGNASLDILTE